MKTFLLKFKKILKPALWSKLLRGTVPPQNQSKFFSFAMISRLTKPYLFPQCFLWIRWGRSWEEATTMLGEIRLNLSDDFLSRTCTFISMTSLLTHTVAYSTRPSFRPKTTNQSIKKFVSLAVTSVKVVKICKILTFKVNVLCQKISESL